MSPTLFAVVLAAAAAAPAPAEEPIKLPTGPAPVPVVAGLDKDGNIEVVQTSTVYRTEARTETVDVNGKKVTKEVLVTVPVTVQSKRLLGAKDVKVYTAAGKEVDAKDVPEKLKKQTIVLLSANGQKVDPFYLKIIKDDTLVIVAPAPVAVMPVPPPPPPKEK